MAASSSRYANCSIIGSAANNSNINNSNSHTNNQNNDDENSQAEGLNSEAGAVCYNQASNNINNNNANNVNNNNNNNNVHYENIYESIEQYAAANAGVPAVAPAIAQNPLGVIPQPPPLGLQANQQPQPGPSSAGMGPRSNIIQPGVAPCPPPPPSMLQMQQQYLSLAYRNELYDRTAGYDVPRGGAPRNNYYQNQQSMNLGPRYQNLHLDLNRPRHSQTNSMRAPRQRSFDDTESYQYHRYQNQNFAKFDNVYERVREEPAYQNTGSFGTAPAGPSNRGMFGRLDVIGHGVGRIERHLSSSCGNIDHYSLGGHYAVLGHSHLGTVGHIRLNPATNNQPSATGKDSSSVNVKSFFSCLGGENSQSMNNISKSATGQPGPSGGAAGGEAAGGSGTSGATPAAYSGSSSVTAKVTGTIPKIKSKSKKESQNNTEPNDGDTQVNRISKPSLQWLLVNKWLPLWVGQTPPDYKFIDFNFMFSRNCDGCGSTTNHQELMRLDGQAEMRSHEYGDYIPPAREYPTMNGSYPRVLRNTPQLSRLREHEYENVPVDSPSGRLDHAGSRSAFSQVNRARSESPARSGASRREERSGGDPFRNWAFNFDDNSFRPAGAVPRPREIRRITDGTFRATDFLQDNERPGPSREVPRESSKTPPTIVVNESAAPSCSRSNSISPPKSKESSVSPVQPERGGTPVSTSSDSENFVMDSIATDAGGPAEDSSGGEGGGGGDGGTISSIQCIETNGDMGEGVVKDKEGVSSQETSESSNFEDNAAESFASDDENADDSNVDAT